MAFVALGKMTSNTQFKSPQNNRLLDKLSRITKNLATPFEPETSCEEGLAKIILALSNFSSVDYRNQGEHSAAIPLPDLASPKQPEILKKFPRVKFNFTGHGKKSQTFSNAKVRKLDESIARLRKTNKELKKKLNKARQELNLGIPKDATHSNASNEVFELEGEGFFHEPEVSCRDGMQQHFPIDNSNIPDPVPTKTSNEKKVFKCDVCPMEFTAKGTLEKHKMKHAHPLKWIECQYCEHTVYAGNMIRHLRIHGSAGEKQQFKCDVCSKNFSRKDHLKFHKLGHMTPQACPFCDKYKTPYPIRLTHHIRMTHNK
ncbi:zinc finger and BTB domain-containing protein 49-like isoform X2 [Daphnia pulex]|uniref:zinc finger and BTB domain-containing protein 49-like isoform X2 n=1 Tax=Daphnia pulex TaxID=6669 RepID=UPI001EDFCC9C|nr:zinc finger and BTB domain-containing protein 49-like isoform X2 [Daphnia pulex]